MPQPTWLKTLGQEIRTDGERGVPGWYLESANEGRDTKLRHKVSREGGERMPAVRLGIPCEEEHRGRIREAAFQVMNQATAVTDQEEVRAPIKVKEAKQRAEAAIAVSVDGKGLGVAMERYLKRYKDHSKTNRDGISKNISNLLSTLDGPNPPTNGPDLIRTYFNQFCSHLPTGSAGRNRYLRDVSNFLKACVTEFHVDPYWGPMDFEELSGLIGTPDGRVLTEDSTVPLKGEQLKSLLDQMEADGEHQLRLAVGLVALLGLRPSELCRLRMVNDVLKIGPVKRNKQAMKLSAWEFRKKYERTGVPLDIPGREGLGDQLIAQWRSGLVGFPKLLQTAVDKASGDELVGRELKNVGDCFGRLLSGGTYRNPYAPWAALRASIPGLVPYSLRHGFAWRAHMEYGTPMSERACAALMGHTTKTHRQHYGSWIDDQGLFDEVARVTGRRVAADPLRDKADTPA